MTVMPPLSPELEAKLQERAAAGKAVTTFVLEAVQEKLRVPQTFAELLAPIHEATRRSGLTQTEINDLIEDARDEVFAERRARRRQ